MRAHHPFGLGQGIVQPGTQILHSRAARRQTGQRNRARWLMFSWCCTAFLAGARLLIWPELTTAGFVEFLAVFLLFGSCYELAIVLVGNHDAESGTSLLFGSLMLLVASLVVFHDWLGASLSLALQAYLLGLVTLFWGLMKMLNQGSGDRDTWAAFALGALHFFLGALLLLTPSLPVLGFLAMLGPAVMLVSLTAVMLTFETPSGPNHAR